MGFGDWHKFTIKADSSGHSAYVEMDGAPLHGVIDVQLGVNAAELITLAIKFVPRAIDIECDVLVDKLKIEQAESLRKKKGGAK